MYINVKIEMEMMYSGVYCFLHSLNICVIQIGAFKFGVMGDWIMHYFVNFRWADRENWIFCIHVYAKTKTQISFALKAKLISTFVFATWIVQSLCFLHVKS